jgi:hypothetical protein
MRGIRTQEGPEPGIEEPCVKVGEARLGIVPLVDPSSGLRVRAGLGKRLSVRPVGPPEDHRGRICDSLDQPVPMGRASNKRVVPAPRSKGA